MVNPLLGDAYIATPDGYFVSAEHQRIAEIIHDYDEDMHLAFIPESKREPGDAPFALIHTPVGAPAYIAFYSDTCDERLLARVFANDLAKTDVWAQLEKAEAAREAIKLKKEMDEAEARKDLVQHIIKSPKATYKHNGVTYE